MTNDPVSISHGAWVWPRTSAQGLADVASACGWDTFAIAGAERTEVYAEFAKALELPDWFGNNLDALYDSLCDAAHKHNKVLFILDIDAFDEDFQRSLRTVFTDASSYWIEKGRALALAELVESSDETLF